MSPYLLIIIVCVCGVGCLLSVAYQLSLLAVRCLLGVTRLLLFLFSSWFVNCRMSSVVVWYVLRVVS